MKFKFRGNQELHLHDTNYWNENGTILPEPINGQIDWSEKDLLELASYAQNRADALSGGGVSSDSYTRSEVSSMKALAKRIRQTLEAKSVTDESEKGVG